MSNQYKYVIVGGGLAGASAVEGIREHDNSGSILLVGKENRLPYDRPPLTKGLWSGKTKLEELPVHDEVFYKTRGVRLQPGTEIIRIDPKGKEISDAQGNRYGYNKLLIATGGTPRRLSFGEGAVQYYRTVDDYVSLTEAAARLNHFLFIGGGFIGGELAAALTMKGKNVTMVFPDENLLQKILPADLAGFVTDYCRSKGVTVMTGDIPTNAERSSGRTLVSTKTGKKLEADMVIAAIGLNLHTDMAKQAGLKVDNGILVNAQLQTSDPNIFAAGDVANFPAKLLDKNIRIEHWNNALTQGKHAGENLTGLNKPFDYLPYFYSDLFDLGFEAIGELDARLQTFADWKEQFREGVVYYVDEGRLRGVLLWNVWEKVDAARDLIAKKKTYKKPEELKGRI